MCYSATASFSASALLAVVGYLTMTTVKYRRHTPIALIPLGFSLQQFAEGIIWLYLPFESSAILPNMALWTFAAFAFVLWPFWVPLAFFISERDPERRRMAALLLMAGTAIGLCNAYLGLAYGVKVDLTCNSLAYSSSGISNFTYYTLMILYVACTVGPMLLSTLRGMRVVGGLNLLAFILCFIIQKETFSSLWCFYAALISCGLLWVLRAESRPEAS